MLNKYNIFETQQFTEDIEDIGGPLSAQLKTKLKNYVYPQLRQQPYFGKNIKKLKNYSPPTWRYRIGSYRLFYTINDHGKIVMMIAVDARKDAY